MRTINKNNILEVSNHIMIAQMDAKEIGELNKEDGGACNFDTVIIKTKGVPTKVLDEISELNDIKFERITSGIWKGYSFILFEVWGIGNRRTRMVRTACNTLKELGYSASVYYELD